MAIPLRVLLLLCLSWLLPGCSTVDREAILVLEDLAAGSAPSRLKAASPRPQKSTLAFQVEGRRYQADLYAPAKPALARIVLVPGAQAAGKDDPRLVDFAQTLARVRFTVLVPELPGLRALRIGSTDVQAVQDAFAYLMRETAPRLPTGFGAFSYAVGPTLLAALRPPVRNSVDFVLAVGGYHDLHRVIAFFTTGYYLDQGTWCQMTPNRYGQWLFVNANLDRLSDPADRELFRRITRRRLDDSAAPVADLVRLLGPEGQTLHELLANTDPQRTPELIARLPDSIRTEINALNLADKPLDALQARLILVHGRDDNIIPYTESLALAKQLPADRVDLFISDQLLHVDVRPSVLQSWRLWRAVSALLRQRRPPS